MLRSTKALALALLAAATPLQAQEAAEASATAQAAATDLGTRIRGVIDGYDEARKTFFKAYREAGSEEAKAKLVEELYPEGGEYCGRLMELVAEDPAYAPCADALVWVMQQSSETAQVDEASELLLAHHIESEQIGTACGVYENKPAGGRAFLEAVAERATSETARTLAKFSLAMHLLEQVSTAARLQAMPEEDRGGYVDYLGADVAAAMATLDVAALNAEAEQLLEHCAEVGGDIERRGGTLGDACARQLFELRNLQVGMVAPDIEGEDIDGVAFKLSDYRGKVVVLDFWGNW